MPSEVLGRSQGSLGAPPVNHSSSRRALMTSPPLSRPAWAARACTHSFTHVPRTVGAERPAVRELGLGEGSKPDETGLPGPGGAGSRTALPVADICGVLIVTWLS